MRDSDRSSHEWLYPQRFDYEPANEMWAAVWLELPLGAGESAPAGPVLAVRSGAVETFHPAFLSCTARVRADGTRPVPGAVPDACAGHLLWRARFSLPLELLDDAEAQFTLRAAGGVAIALPAPNPPAAITTLQSASAPAVLRVRRQAVAFAAGFVAASIPVTAAAADTSPTGASSGTAGTTTTTTTPSTDPSGTGTADGSGTTTTSTTTTGTTTTGTPATTGTTTTGTTTTGTTTTGTTTTGATTTTAPTASTPPPATSTAPPSTTTTATAPPVAPITSSEGASPPVHRSGGDSIAKPAPKAPSKSGSHHTGKHQTALKCTEAVPAKTKARLSKRALAQLERTASKTKTKCMSVVRKKHHTTTHRDHRVVHRDVHGRASFSGGAGVKPVVQTTDQTLLTGGSTLFQPNPAAASAWSRLSLLFARGDRPPPFLVPIYKAAARKYHVPWPVLAAINAVETDYGRDLKTSSAGAMGWMQFMPGTWMAYGVAVGNHDVPNPYDPRDAIYAAARYLSANGARHSLRRAIFAYNHARWYVDEVLWTAANIIDHSRVRGSRARVRVAAMQAMASALEGEPYLWGGGHGSWEISAGYDCSGFVSAVLHTAGYLKAPVTTQALPDQRNIMEGPGRYVTIFDRTDGGGLADDHVIIDIHGQWWESGGESGAGVHRMKHVSASYLLTFNQILHPRGL